MSAAFVTVLTVEIDPTRESAAPLAAAEGVRRRLEAAAALCAQRGGRAEPLGARSAAFCFAGPLEALEAAPALRPLLGEAPSPAAGPDACDGRIGLGFGTLRDEGGFAALERPAGGAGGETRASLAFVEAARSLGARAGFAYVGRRRRPDDVRTLEVFRLVDPRASTACPARRAIPAAPDAPLSEATLVAPAFVRVGAGRTPLWLREGLAAEVASRLARDRGLALFARGAAERARPPDGDALDAARALGARYLVEGDLACDGGALRAGARILDAASGRVLWSAGRVFAFDRLHAAPKPLADELAAAIAGGAAARERARAEAAPRSVGRAYDLVLRAEAVVARLGPAASGAAAPIDAALALAPDYPRALALRARWLCARWRGDPRAGEDMLEEALAAASAAVEADALDARAFAALAEALLLSEDASGALEAAQAAAARDPNATPALLSLGLALARLDRAAEAEAALRRAMRLDPFFPDALFSALAAARFNAGDAAGAAEALSRMADPAEAGWLLAAALAATGETDAAAAAARRAREATPGATPRRVARVLAVAPGAPRARLAAAFA